MFIECITFFTLVLGIWFIFHNCFQIKSQVWEICLFEFVMAILLFPVLNMWSELLLAVVDFFYNSVQLVSFSYIIMIIPY